MKRFRVRAHVCQARVWDRREVEKPAWVYGGKKLQADSLFSSDSSICWCGGCVVDTSIFTIFILALPFSCKAWSIAYLPFISQNPTVRPYPRPRPRAPNPLQPFSRLPHHPHLPILNVIPPSPRYPPSSYLTPQHRVSAPAAASATVLVPGGARAWRVHVAAEATQGGSNVHA